MSLIEIFEVLQVSLGFYILFILIKNRIEWAFVILYTMIVMLFMWLKLQFIPYELWGTLDRFLWGTYNILLFLFLIFILIEMKDDRVRKLHTRTK